MEGVGRAFEDLLYRAVGDARQSRDLAETEAGRDTVDD